MHQFPALVRVGSTQRAYFAIVFIALLIVILASCGTEEVDHSEYQDWEQLTDIELLLMADSLFDILEPDLGFRAASIVAERRTLQVTAPDSLLAEALIRLGRFFGFADKNEQSLAYYSSALSQLYYLYGEKNSRYFTLLHALASTTRCVATEEAKSDAEELHWEAYRICVEIFGDSSVETVNSTANLGVHYFVTQEFERADSLLRIALSLSDRLMDRYDSARWTILRTLGLLNRHRCRYLEAEEYLLELLEIADSIPACDPRSVIDVLTGLSYMYGAQARYDEAEQRIAEALELYELFGIREDANRSSLHKNLGNIHMYQDRLEDAKDAYWKSFEIRSRTCGVDSVGLAESLNNIGLLCIKMGRYGEAEEHLRRALRLRSDILGEKHTYNVYPLTGLGELFTVMAEYDTADVYYRQALEICLDRYDEDHLHTGWCYKGLADTRRFRGMYAEAESLYMRSLSVAENALGIENAEVANILLSLAHLYGSTGEYDRARAAYKRMLGSRHEFIEKQFIAATESQKLRFLGIHPLIINSLFSLALVDSSAESRELDLEMVLRGKAIVMDAVAAVKEIAWCSCIEDLRAMAEQWQDVSSRISELTITRANVGDIGDIVRRLDSLVIVRDSLEHLLSVQCSEAAMELREREFTLSDVANALGENQVLCEIVRYEPYDFSAVGCDTCKTGPPRYTALTFDHSGEVSICDLGDVAEIDSIVTLTRKMIYSVGESLDVYSEKGFGLESDLRKVTSKLRELIFTPLESELAGRTELFISPDGALNLLPFEILPASNDSYLVEEYSISYLSTGRDLLKHDEEETCKNTATLVASPDFDSAAVAVAGSVKSSIYQTSFANLSRISTRGTNVCLTGEFFDLPSGRVEVDVISKLLEAKADLSISTYTGPDAREEVIREASRPYLIHVSTHGFFCEDVDATSVYTMDDPLQRSGLALAGINNTIRNPGQSVTGNGDGILTASEVSGCDLSGTELVVLSACETGIGEVKNSEGVFGLRRAFHHAGVRSLIMSLWKVHDIEAIEIMKSFYESWLTDGLSRKEALRRSILHLIEQNRVYRVPTHPAIWGAFVYAGDPD